MELSAVEEAAADDNTVPHDGVAPVEQQVWMEQQRRRKGSIAVDNFVLHFFGQKCRMWLYKYHSRSRQRPMRERELAGAG